MTNFYHVCYLAQEDLPVNLCTPSPCGPNSQCKVVNGQSVCSCLSEYIGSPPNCRPECVVNSECPSDKACIKQKCKSPCLGACGENSECRVLNHSPICTCRTQYTGDPFTKCYIIIQGKYFLVKYYYNLSKKSDSVLLNRT